jgi:hypothetical protein
LLAELFEGHCWTDCEYLGREKMKQVLGERLRWQNRSEVLLIVTGPKVAAADGIRYGFPPSGGNVE